MQLHQKGVRGADADRDCACEGNAEIPLHPAAAGFGNLWIEADVQIRLRQALDVSHAGAKGGHHAHIHAMNGQEPLHFEHVIAAAESQQRGAEQIHPRPPALGFPGLCVVLRLIRHLWLQQAADQLIQRFGCSPVFFFAVSRQFQGHHRHPQVHPLGQGTGLVLNQFSGATLANEQCLRLKALGRFPHRSFHQFGSVASQIPGLKGGVGDRRALTPSFDHREQEVGIGVPLGCMQHVVHVAHRCGDAHGAHMRRALIGPERELHGIQT